MALRTEAYIPNEPPETPADWEAVREMLWVLTQKQYDDDNDLTTTLDEDYSKGQDGTAEGQIHVWDNTDLRWEASSLILVDRTTPQITIATDVTMSDNSLSDVSQIDFTLGLSAPTHQEGRLYWDDDDKTLTAMMEVSGVSLQIGQEMHLRAKNESGAQIDNGKVVYISGASGQRPTIGLAKADSDATSNGKTIGLATHDIAKNSTGYVTISGYVRDVNTSAWAEGTSLYLSAVTAGALTSTIPTAPNRKIKVGCVMYQHATEGIILVHIQDSREIEELHDVYVNSIADLHALVWDNGNSRWANTKLDHTVHLDSVGTYTHAQIDTHIAGSALKHAASVITYDNSSSGLVATEVQSAIDEIDGDLDTHIADVANPHATTWLLLGDTPSSYSGQELRLPRVNNPSVVDSYTVFLAHFDGGDGDTTTTDSALGGNAPHTITLGGNLELDDAQKQYGTTSLKFDGSSQAIIGDSADWDFGSGDFTIECWVYKNGFPASGAWGFICRDWSDSSPQGFIWWESDGGGFFFTADLAVSGSTSVLVEPNSSIPSNTWTHIAVTRNGSSWKMWRGGNQVASATNTEAIADSANDLIIGTPPSLSGSWTQFTGWIDEVRISKGIARYTNPFTPSGPFSEYTGGGGGGADAIEFSNVEAGTSTGLLVYDDSDADYIQVHHDGTNAIVSTNAGDLQLVPDASTDVSLFADSASGETRALELSGYRTGDSLRTASFAISSTANDTLETTGLTYYTWDGNIVASGGMDNTVIGANTAVAGTFTTLGATTGNITTVNATTVDTTNIEVTNIKAKDGTACAVIADSTGVITVGSSVLTTTDINGGTIDGATIGVNSSSIGSFTYLGVGAAAPTISRFYSLHAPENLSGASAILAICNATATANGTYSNRGIYSIANKTVSAGVTDSGYIYGIQSSAEAEGEGTLALMYGLRSEISTESGTVTVTNAYNFVSAASTAASTTITNRYAVYLTNPSDSGTVTNDWALYSVNTADSYLIGSLGVGIEPTSKLHISDTLTDSSGSSALIQSTLTTSSSGTYTARGLNVSTTADVDSGQGNTGTYYGIQNTVTYSDTGNLTNLYGIDTSLDVTSGGGTVSNAYGFRINSSTASGNTVTTRYALFIGESDAGTVTNNRAIWSTSVGDSYFAGSVGIGTQSPDNELHVSGAAKITHSDTDTDNAYGMLVRQVETISDDLSRTNYGIGVVARENVAAGKTNSGIYYGQSLVVSSGDEGDLGTLYGMYISAGTLSTGNITNQNVLQLSAYSAAGSTITTRKIINIPTLSDSGVATNEYCLYVAHTADNYFAGNLDIHSDSKVLYCGADKDMKIGYDGTDAFITTDLQNASDLVIDCGTAKTIELTVPVYEDIQFHMSTGQGRGVNEPSWSTFTTNTKCYQFDVDDVLDLEAQELNHKWKEGTTGNFHLHLALDAASPAALRYAKFEIYVAYSDATTGVYSEATLTAELTIPESSDALKEFYLDMGDIAFTNKVIGSQVVVSVKRIAATTGTDYADEIFITQCGCHIQQNTIGSRTEAAK